MKNVIPKSLLILFLISCNDNNKKVEVAKSEYNKTAKMLSNFRIHVLPSTLRGYMYRRTDEIAWNEFEIDEDSVRTENARKSYLTVLLTVDSLKSVCDSLFKIAFEPGTEDYKTAKKNLDADSINAESELREKQSEWENQTISSLLTKSYGIKKALQIIDNVSIHDFYGGTPPKWYINHRESTLKRYKKVFGSDFK